MIRIEKATAADKTQASKYKGDDLNTWFVERRSYLHPEKLADSIFGFVCFRSYSLKV